MFSIECFLVEKEEQVIITDDENDEEEVTNEFDSFHGCFILFVRSFVR